MAGKRFSVSAAALILTVTVFLADGSARAASYLIESFEDIVYLPDPDDEFHTLDPDEVGFIDNDPVHTGWFDWQGNFAVSLFGYSATGVTDGSKSIIVQPGSFPNPFNPTPPADGFTQGLAFKVQLAPDPRGNEIWD